jgi:hypothetical protein
MRVRRLALWLLLFVAVDFGTPFIGGAFTFDAEMSAEGLGFHRDRAMARSQPALMPLPVPVGSELVSRHATGQTERTNASALRWVTALPRARILPEPPSAPSDDH